jgi:hypothetical protein
MKSYDFEIKITIGNNIVIILGIQFSNSTFRILNLYDVCSVLEDGLSCYCLVHCFVMLTVSIVNNKSQATGWNRCSNVRLINIFNHELVNFRTQINTNHPQELTEGIAKEN